MLKLIRKDLILHRRFLLAIGILFPIYFGYFGSRLSRATVVEVSIFAAFICAVLPFSLIGREDKFKSLPFALSLPATRREVVLSRYLLSWGLMLYLYVSGAILMTVFPGTKLTAAAVFALQPALISLSFMALFFAVLMPLFVRFGPMGMLVFIVALQVLGVLLLVFKSLISLRAIKAALLLVPKAVSAIQASAGAAAAALGAAALLILLTYASFELSAAVFRKREF